jgi:hypothetical protein
VYKRITHNIIEEHYDHPIASQIKKSLMKSRLPRLPNTDIFEKKKFQDDVNAYFSNYGSNINGMIDMYDENEEELAKKFEGAFFNIDDIGNMTKPFFYSELGERINVAMRCYPIYLLMAMHLEKVGQDSGWVTTRFGQVADDLTSALTQFSVNWPSADLNSFLKTLGLNIKERLLAVRSKNLTKSEELRTTLQNQLTTLGNIIHIGIANKFPDRFQLPNIIEFEYPCPTPTPAM